MGLRNCQNHARICEYWARKIVKNAFHGYFTPIDFGRFWRCFSPVGGLTLRSAVGAPQAPSAPWQRAVGAPQAPSAPWQRAVGAPQAPSAPWQRAVGAPQAPSAPWQRAVGAPQAPSAPGTNHVWRAGATARAVMWRMPHISLPGVAGRAPRQRERSLGGVGSGLPSRTASNTCRILK